MTEDKGDLRFGLTEPHDWLAKARRELDRVRTSEPRDKIDHAINAAMTIAHIADWCFNYATEKGLIDKLSRNDFLSRARKTSPDTAILTDISNTSKHYKLDRRPVSDAIAVSSGQVTVPREFLYSEFVPTDKESFTADIKAIRTIIDDDEIVGFQYVVGQHRVLTNDGYRSYEITCDAAIAFWADCVDVLTKEKTPPWTAG